MPSRRRSSSSSSKSLLEGCMLMASLVSSVCGLSPMLVLCLGSAHHPYDAGDVPNRHPLRLPFHRPSGKLKCSIKATWLRNAKVDMDAMTEVTHHSDYAQSHPDEEAHDEQVRDRRCHDGMRARHACVKIKKGHGRGIYR